MLDNIKRVKEKTKAILELCYKIKCTISSKGVWDFNNEIQTPQYVTPTDLDCKKLIDRAREVATFCDNMHLSITIDLMNKINTFASKQRIYLEDIDVIIYEFDSLDNKMDNLEYASNKVPVTEHPTEKHLMPKIFISHSTDDEKYVKCLVELLEDIGISEKQIFCSSLPEYGIALNEDIYDTLKLQFKKFNLQVIFVLSNNYYNSAACLNEMGAAWILQNWYSAILLPSFEYKNIKGAINPNKVSIKLGNSNVPALLNQLKDELIKKFILSDISQTKWERHRNDFIEKINNIL